MRVYALVLSLILRTRAILMLGNEAMPTHHRWKCDNVSVQHTPHLQIVMAHLRCAEPLVCHSHHTFYSVYYLHVLHLLMFYTEVKKNNHYCINLDCFVYYNQLYYNAVQDFKIVSSWSPPETEKENLHQKVCSVRIQS